MKDQTAASDSLPIDGSTLSRRQFLKRSTCAVAGVAFGSHFLGLLAKTARAAELPAQKNILLILTDQERPTMWFPDGWEAANLPNLTRLKGNGLTFNRAFCSAACCTPSRNSFFTGLFPAQHGSVDTLSDILPQNQIERQLDPALPNLATCLKEAGYDVVYKGKWHMTTPVTGADGSVISDDISRYGFDGWNAPDAGTTLQSRGGGTPNNDQRFLEDAIAFLQHRLAHPSPRPFCLVVSLVNPHDVITYPLFYQALGYTSDPWISPTTPEIELPPTVDENLITNKKPTAQPQFVVKAAQVIGPLPTTQLRRNYLNFYANLIRKVDGQIGQLLAVFDDNGSAGRQLLEDTLIIRTSDHGEMGLSHDTMRQKCFVAYEEVLRVPLVWSNPVMFPTARTTDALVSHVDFLPTLCALTGVPDWRTRGFQGVDYSSLVLDPAAAAVQDYVLFTYDDIYAGQSRVDFPDGIAPPPNCIQAIRTADFKYVRYYDPAGVEPDQEEFYDLRPGGGDYSAPYRQPLELANLSEWAANRYPHPPTLTDEQQTARMALKTALAAAVADRLQPRPASAPAGPGDIKIQIVQWTDGNGPHERVQLTFFSRFNETYQLQRSIDLLTWTDLDDPIPGNNGPVLRHYDLSDTRAFYRVQWQARVSEG